MRWGNRSNRIWRISPVALVFAAAIPVVNVSAQVARFLTPVSYAVPGASMAVLADVNGDGFLDVVTANGYVFKGNGVSLLLGNGDGTFKPAKKIVTGGNPSWIAVGDFNHDGKPDIAVANEPNPNDPLVPGTTGGPAQDSVSILLGNGDGTFKLSIDTPTLGALTMAAADFNGDGKLDLVVTTGETSAVQLLLGNGDGTFVVSDTAATGLGYIMVGDFNRDGKKDFLAGFAEMLGHGDGTFNVGPVLPLGAEAVGDFNGDGILDMATVISGGNKGKSGGGTSFGSSDGSFSPNIVVSTFTSDGNLLAADFNGDGKLDVFGPGETQILGPENQLHGGLFLGGSDGSFTQASPGFGFSLDGTDGVGFPAFSAMGDLDRNGSPDVIIAVGTGVLVALNTFGHPPLLAQVRTDATFVVGGATEVTGTLALGGPAPVGGAIITLASSNLAASFPNGKTVTIPAGASSATFPISTEAVTATTAVTITATYHTTKLTTQINLVLPFTVSSVAVAPVSPIGMFGGDAVAGTVTLSGPAANGTVVKLASSNPAVLTVPASISFAPGAKTAIFSASALHVAADTSVTITSTLAGKTHSGTVTVRKEIATVTVTKAEYVVKKGQLTIQATSTDIEPIGSDVIPSLQVYNASTGALIGSIRLVGSINKGVGTFGGQLPVAGTLTSVAAQSFAGGLSILPVAQK
jgi:hypothetical protein